MSYRLVVQQHVRRRPGFCAAEVHGAYDSLLARFLSPLTNQRTDRWGGTVENRVKVHCKSGRIRRWQEGNRGKSTCISRNKCGYAISKGLPLACYLDRM